MPVVVDLPLVPATPIADGASLKSWASSSARDRRAAPTSAAAITSGTLSSTAAEATRICPARKTPEPSWAWSAIPNPLKLVEFGVGAPLIEGPVGPFDMMAGPIDDHRQGEHARTANTTEEIVFCFTHCRIAVTEIKK